jgi:transcriptional regulator with XRE-family HTH domain
MAAQLNQRLRELRTRRGLSLRALGEAVGVTAQSVWDWEKGRSQLPSNDIPKIADTLGVTICELYGIDEGHEQRKDDLTSAEREALDNIARELVKLRRPTAERRRQPSTGQQFMRDVLQAWPTMDEAERQEWRELAAEIRQADEEKGR